MNIRQQAEHDLKMEFKMNIFTLVFLTIIFKLHSPQFLSSMPSTSQ